MSITRIGYGQVEPNHLSARRTGQIFAQLPLADGINQVENGQFLKYDYANGEAGLSGGSEWFLVLHEVKNYEGFGAKNFVLSRDAFDYPTPRLLKTNVGDIYTTNTLESAATSKDGITTTSSDYEVGNTLGINSNGFLDKTGSKTEITFEVVEVYTMPDGQAGIKVMRVK